MSFAQDNGYTPKPFSEIVEEVRLGINEKFQTNFTESSFIGTSWYKYLYALMQKASLLEIKTAEIFAKLAEYINQTNLRIQRPSVSLPGLIDSFAAVGFVASVRKMTSDNRGLQGICIDLDSEAPDYAQKKLLACQRIAQFGAAGIVTEGDQTETIVLSNGQSFDFKFYLPNRTAVLLRVTFTVSENNLLVIPTDEELRQLIFDQVNARYRLGWDFEPQKYITVDDTPWASEITFEWSDNDGSTWSEDVFDADFQDLFEFGLEDISVIIN